MPEGAAAAAGAARELILAEHASQLPDGIPWVAFGESAAAGSLGTTDALRPHRERLRAAFVDWLGRCNIANASAAWWAHTTTAKNLLSSPFGNQVFELLGLKLLLEAAAHARVGVAGASRAQTEALERFAQESAGGLRVTRLGTRGAGAPLALPRLLYHLLRLLAAWLRWLRPSRRRESDAGGLHVLTYADAGFRGEDDAFFGPLAKLLQDAPRYHAYVHGDFGVVAPLLRSATRYAPFLAELSLADLFGAFGDTVAALRRVRQWTPPGRLEGMDLEPLVRVALRDDIANGSYFHNLLVHRAALRLGRRLRPGAFLYPYENKSLEKMLLLGLREAHPALRIVGYQHTSVTPRHATLLFAEGEAQRTPLPDRIVTCGAVTCSWLAARGRYPAEMLVEGAALRQPQRAPLERRPPARDAARILFALSSSAAELDGAVQVLLDVARLRPGWKFALRPHPEFPLSVLPDAQRAELLAKAQDLSGTPLAGNLEWADVVVYASSTVGLEALMAGRPAVNLDLDEPLEVDPVLEPVSLHWSARDAADLVGAVEQIGALDEREFAERGQEARDFTARYFRAPTQQALDMLVRIPPR